MMILWMMILTGIFGADAPGASLSGSIPLTKRDLCFLIRKPKPPESPWPGGLLFFDVEVFFDVEAP
jgi:hypothetical protein